MVSIERRHIREPDLQPHSQQPSDTQRSDESDDQIAPPLSYLVGLTLFFLGIGLNFGNMASLENAATYRSIIAVIMAFGFLIAYGARGPVRRAHHEFIYTKLMLNVWIFYAAYLSVITLFRTSDLLNTIYSGTVFYFMIMSMTLAYRHIESEYDNKYFWNGLFGLAIMSTVINLYISRYGSTNFVFEDIGFLQEVRSEINSPGLTILIAIGMINIIRSKNVAISSLLVGFVLFIYLISKTRNILLGVTTLVIFVALVHERRATSVVRTIMLVLISICATYLITSTTSDFNIFHALIDRVLTDDNRLDIETYNTRLAEYAGQLKMLLSDTQSAIFGFGFIQTMIWDPHIWDLLYPDIDPTYYYETRSIGQHSTWINSLFHGGVIFGTIPFLMFTSMFFASIGFIFLESKKRAELDIYGLYGASVIVLSWLPANFGMMFADRLGPAITGPCLIYCVYCWEKSRQTQDRVMPRPMNNSDRNETAMRQHIR